MASVVDWWAVACVRHTVEYVAKPAATLLFLASALALDPANSDVRTWFCVALVLCVAGDVFLMLPVDAFVPGLGAFLVAQICFAIGFAHYGLSAGDLALGAGIVAVIAIPLATRFVRALVRRDQRVLVVPVLAYVAALAAMVTTAVAGANGWGIAGALLFLSSDSLIGEQRFVAERAWMPVAIMVTYHAALALLVVSVVP